MDGITSTREIREFEKNNRIEPALIVALGGQTSEAIQQDCAKAGTNMLLPKPVKFKEFRKQRCQQTRMAPAANGHWRHVICSLLVVVRVGGLPRRCSLDRSAVPCDLFMFMITLQAQKCLLDADLYL